MGNKFWQLTCNKSVENLQQMSTVCLAVNNLTKGMQTHPDYGLLITRLLLQDVEYRMNMHSTRMLGHIQLQRYIELSDDLSSGRNKLPATHSRSRRGLGQSPTSCLHVKQYDRHRRSLGKIGPQIWPDVRQKGIRALVCGRGNGGRWIHRSAGKFGRSRKRLRGGWHGYPGWRIGRRGWRRVLRTSLTELAENEWQEIKRKRIIEKEIVEKKVENMWIFFLKRRIYHIVKENYLEFINFVVMLSREINIWEKAVRINGGIHWVLYIYIWQVYYFWFLYKSWEKSFLSCLKI